MNDLNAARYIRRNKFLHVSSEISNSNVAAPFSNIFISIKNTINWYMVNNFYLSRHVVWPNPLRLFPFKSVQKRYFPPSSDIGSVSADTAVEWNHAWVFVPLRINFLWVHMDCLLRFLMKIPGLLNLKLVLMSRPGLGMTKGHARC